MAKFKMGGSGPDGRGLGNVEGVGRFDYAGEVFETTDPRKLIILKVLCQQGFAIEIKEDQKSVTINPKDLNGLSIEELRTLYPHIKARAKADFIKKIEVEHV